MAKAVLDSKGLSRGRLTPGTSDINANPDCVDHACAEGCDDLAPPDASGEMERILGIGEPAELRQGFDLMAVGGPAPAEIFGEASG